MSAIEDLRKCSACGEQAQEFRDDLSAREYRISGMCQDCQDRFFTETAEQFELHGGDMTITIAVDVRRNGSATIEAFAVSDDGVYDIHTWTTDATARKRVASVVIVAVTMWQK